MRRLFLILLFLAVVAVGGYLGLNLWQGDDGMARDFNEQEWKDETAATQEPYPRRQMIADVLDRKVAIGQSREEIVQLLGPPTETPYFRDYDLVYWLGPERSAFSVDSLWLVLRLDGDGRVTEIKTVTD